MARRTGSSRFGLNRSTIGAYSQDARFWPLAKLPRPGDREMLLALIIGAAAVVAFICSFAMFLEYMREDADDDGNSKRPAGVNRVRPVAQGQALGEEEAQEGPMTTVRIYVDTRYHVGHPDH